MNFKKSGKLEFLSIFDASESCDPQLSHAPIFIKIWWWVYAHWLIESCVAAF